MSSQRHHQLSFVILTVIAPHILHLYFPEPSSLESTDTQTFSSHVWHLPFCSGDISNVLVFVAIYQTIIIKMSNLKERIWENSFKKSSQNPRKRTKKFTVGLTTKVLIFLSLLVPQYHQLLVYELSISCVFFLCSTL